jgi:hypothetical protein
MATLELAGCDGAPDEGTTFSAVGDPPDVAGADAVVELPDVVRVALGFAADVWLALLVGVTPGDACVGVGVGVAVRIGVGVVVGVGWDALGVTTGAHSVLG